jgi:hypothetical protein
MAIGNSSSALFAGSCQQFVEMAPASTLTAHLVNQFNSRWGTVTASEQLAWKRSLAALARVADEPSLLHAGVGVELRLPLTDKRIDVSFVGRDGKAQPQVVLVELKQWDRVEPSDFPDNIVIGGKEFLHPSVQAANYAAYLRDSHSAFTEHGFILTSCAFLHDMSQSAATVVKNDPYRAAVREAPLFARGEEPALRNMLAKSLAGGEGMTLLPQVVAGRYSPSKRLIESVAKSLAESPVWILLDDQRVAFNVVLGLVEKTARTGTKASVVVEGGPGTGKSVIALHLLVSLSHASGYRVCHATGSKAFTTNLRALAPSGGRALFQYFNNFRHKATPTNAVDVLICDEAHRIRDTSNDRFTKKTLRSEISQVRELIRAARVSVFLLDERQNVRPGEIGTVKEIEEGAAEEGTPVYRLNLNGQFRCNGCSAYIDWVDGLLSDAPAPAGGWREAGDYALRVFDSPDALQRAVEEKCSAGFTGRLVAGFCWPWSDPREDGSLVDDVRIGSWSRPWNEKSREQTRAGGASPAPARHPYYIWATQPHGIEQVGCIYSAQGFEFDYCAVIVGDDFVWRSNQGWVASKQASEDPAIKRGSLSVEGIRALLGQTYRVLLTRGMKGTFVYSTDAETQALLRRLTGADL